MKKLLLVINCVLAFLLAAALWSTFGNVGSPMQVVSAKKKKSGTKETAKPVAVQPPPARFQYPADNAAVSLIVNKNIFNAQRIGGAVGGRGTVTYSLVGFTKVGSVQTAVILSKGNVRRTNNMPPKQYYRVGDELPNGYALSQINPQTGEVTLSRGSSTMTLKMAQASENFPAARTRRAQPNQTQQMLNLMRMQMNMQQQQQMNMMRMMRNNQNSGSSGRSGSTNSRGRR